MPVDNVPEEETSFDDDFSSDEEVPAQKPKIRILPVIRPAPVTGSPVVDTTPEAQTRADVSGNSIPYIRTYIHTYIHTCKNIYLCVVFAEAGVWYVLIFAYRSMFR